jgi:hypothetical protein
MFLMAFVHTAAGARFTVAWRASGARTTRS